jgi:Zn-dependent peptidase ImmA (M78 family)/DNA-binding XRE family transcriptional regulator
MVLDSPINPQMIMLARLSRGLTQGDVAEAIGVTQATISKVESGLLQMDVDQLEELATYLQYPSDFFRRRDVIDGPGLPEMYHARRRKTVRAMVLSRAYAMASIKRMHVEALLRSTNQAATEFPRYPREEYGDPAEIARTVRAHFELPVGPIINMTEVVEQAGGIVVKCDFESRQIDGFSKWKPPTVPPLFFINRHSPPDRCRWTLAHELGHVIMHTGQMGSNEIEDEANLFAEEFLTPARYIKPLLMNPTLQKLAALKLQWKVSVQALISRAYHLDLISYRQQSYLYSQWTKAGFRLREPKELDPPEEEPRSLMDLVQFHLQRLGYSAADLGKLLALYPDELKKEYLELPAHLRNQMA